jgi:hypothetical protein
MMIVVWRRDLKTGAATAQGSRGAAPESSDPGDDYQATFLRR